VEHAAASYYIILSFIISHLPRHLMPPLAMLAPALRLRDTTAVARYYATLIEMLLR